MSFIIPFTTFYIVANPATFKAVRGVAGNWVASADGLPTTLGLLLHSLVFVILCRLIWNLLTVRKSGFGGKTALSGGCKKDADCMFGGCKGKKCALF
jgi:hypothetical protein